MDIVIKDNLDKLKYTGRYEMLDDGVSFDHTANCLAFNCDCEGDVLLTLTSHHTEKKDDRYLKCILTVFVDGERSDIEFDGVNNGAKTDTVKIAEGLKKGSHFIEIYKRNEASIVYYTLHRLSFDGELRERPEDKEMLIFFLGDSLTAGYGNLTTVEDGDVPSCPEKSDGTKTYAFMTAKNLNADMSAVCASGLAFTFKYADKFDAGDFFLMQNCFRGSNEYDFDNQRKPDVVVVNLGTNDANYMNKHGTTYEDVYNGVQRMLKIIREKYPTAKIIWSYGMLNKDITRPIKNAVEDMGGEKSGYWFCLLYDYGVPRGGHWHSSVEGHKMTSAVLSDYLQRYALNDRVM